MKAVVTTRYGPPDVLEATEVPLPTIGEHDVLVRVHAAAVTAGDRRLRTADFPSISALPGRLMIGVRRPKNRVQGTMFAGRVVEVGGAVTRYAPGDDVFGSTEHGAYAEHVAVPEDGALAKMPASLDYAKAAAVPYGAVTALQFLRDVGEVRPGERVLILGASGGVGRFAVQIAKHLGAEVTAVASPRSFDLLRELGAANVVDYKKEDALSAGARYDVIFDVAGVATFSRARSALTDRGRYLTLFVSPGVLLQMGLTALRGGRRAKFTISMGNAKDMDEVRALVEQGVLRPIVADPFPLERIREAHAAVDSGRTHGTVVVTVVAPAETAKEAEPLEAAQGS